MCGGGSSGPTESTVTQTNLPEYAEPFYRDLLARVGYESATPYEAYQAPRLEYFSPAEQEAMRRFEQPSMVLQATLQNPDRRLRPGMFGFPEFQNGYTLPAGPRRRVGSSRQLSCLCTVWKPGLL